MQLVNIFNKGRLIYLFTRDEKGTLSVEKKNDFFPYYYAQDSVGEMKSFDGVSLRKIFVSNPRDIPKQRKNDSYEADILFVKRFMLDKINKLEKCPIKYTFIDIEVLIPKNIDVKTALQNPIHTISCISAYNSLYGNIQTWYIEDFNSEYELMSSFIGYMKKEQFDLWCLTPDTIINTENGIKKLEDIKIGDILLSFKSNNFVRSEVKYLRKKRENLYEIRTNSSYLECSKQHIHPILKLKISDQKNSFIVDKKSFELTKEDYLLFPINYLEDNGNREDYYWLVGYYIGDGTLGNGNRFEIKDANFSSLQNVKEYLTTIGIKCKINIYGNCYTLYSYDNKAKALLSKFKIIGKNMLTYLNMLTIEQQLSFIGGFIDAEGSYDKKYHNLSISNTNKDLLDWIRYILWGVGIPTHLYVVDNKETKSCSNKMAYIVTISNNQNNKKLYIKHPDKKLFFDLEYKYIKKDTLPIREFVLNIFKQWNIVIPKKYYKLLTYHNNTISRKFSYELLNYLKDKANNRYKKYFIKRLIKFLNKFHIEKIKEIEKTKDKTIIEMSLTNSPYFVANHILTHNCSWNVSFDYNYLAGRFPDFAEKIGYKGQTRYGDGEVFYPSGISIVDYLAWYKKVTLNRKKSYALDYIAQEDLGEKSCGQTDFSKLNPKIKEKNINDVLRMVKLEENKKLIPYFDEIRRMSKVEWEDLIWHSRIIDMLLLQEAKDRNVALPMKPDERRGTLSEKEEYEGAYRDVFQTGDLYNVTKYDLSSAYPMAIINFCLDPANILEYQTHNGNVNICYTSETQGNTSTLINNIMFAQNSNALLPLVARRLVNLKKEVKKKVKETKLNSPEHKDMKIMYDAIKTIVNSCYGVFGNRFFRLYSKEVASATTFIVRSLLHYVQEKIELEGYKVVYVDTDSVFIQSEKNLSDRLNELIKEWAKKIFQKDKIDFDFGYEGIYERIFILTKCRYKGWLKTDEGIEIEEKGLEAKRKDSTVYMKIFQTELLERITTKQSKESIMSWIKDEIKNFKSQSLQNISLPCKIAKKLEEYKNVPIFVRALNNTVNYERKIGEPFYYIYIKPTEYETKIVEKDLIQTYNKAGEEKGFKNVTSKRLERACYLNLEENYNDLLIASDDPEEKIKKRLIAEGLLKTESIEMKGKAKDVVAFDEINFAHIKREDIDFDLMINRNILMKLSTIFEAMQWKEELEDIINYAKSQS